MADRARSSGLIPGLVPAGVLLLAGVLLTACGGGSYVVDQPGTPEEVQALERTYTNPDRCLALVEEHRAEPATFETGGPQPLRMRVPVGLEGGRWVVDLVVDEHGKAVPESIEVTGEGPGTSRLRLRDVTISLPFRPARLDGCWVPARFS